MLSLEVYAQKIIAECRRLLDDAAYYRQFALCSNPYGDGTASKQIVAKIVEYGAKRIL